MQRLRRYRPDFLIALGLFLLPLAFFWQVTVGGKTLLPADNLYQFQPWAGYRAEQGVPEIPHNALLSDLVLQNYQWKLFMRGALASGELPLWNPYLLGGVPFLAAGQHSALYPFSLISYLLPLESAYGWFTVSQLWLAGVLMYLFMRGLPTLKIGRFAAALSAVAYQMSGFFLAGAVVFQTVLASAAWLPLLLLMCEWIIVRRPLFGKPAVIPWLVIGAFGLGMCILAGHVEFVYYALLVMGGWSAWRLVARTVEGRSLSRALLESAAALLVMMILGIGLGAVQAVPLVELASQNFREGSASFDTVRGYGYPPRHALALLMPNLYGSPAEHDYFDVFTGRVEPFRKVNADGSTVTNTFWQIGKNYVEGACYVGLLTLVFAGFAVVGPRRMPYKWPLIILAVLCVLFIFGTPAYALLYYGLPGVNQLHSPFRWAWPLTFALAVLAGFGAARIQACHTTMQRTLRVAGTGLIAVGLLVIGALIIGRFLFAQLKPTLERVIAQLAGADTVFPDAESFFSLLVKNNGLFGIFVIGIGVVLLLARSEWKVRSIWVWQPLALLVLALDLTVASVGFNPAADPKWLAFEPPAITFLKGQNPTEWRFITIDAGGHPMNANIGVKYGLADVSGYDSIIPRQYVEYWGQAQPQTMLIYNRIAPIVANKLDVFEAGNLLMLGVRYAVSETPVSHPYLKLVFEDRGTYIYQVSGAVSRAFVVPNGTAQVTESRLNQVTVDAIISNAETERLILTDSMFPGWRAFVREQGTPETAEKETPIQLYNGNFRSVELPPGRWTVRFRYTPQSVQFGAFASFLSFVILLFMLVVYGWRNLVRGESSGAGRVARNIAAPVFLSLFNRALDFAFAAVMLRILPTAENGAYTYAIVIIGWFEILTNFGLNTFLTREVARDHGSAALYFRRTTFLRLALAVAWLPLLLLFFGYFTRQAQTNSDPLDGTTLLVIILFYIGIIPSSLNNGLSALFYAFERAETPAAYSTVTALLSIIARLGVLILGWGILGLAGVSIAVSAITTVLLARQALPLLRSKRSEPAEPDRRTETPRPAGYQVMLGESWPLMLNHLLATVFFKIDIVLLEALRGKDTVAQYGTAYKWVDAIGVIPAFFTMAMLPIMSRLASQDSDALKRMYQLAVKLLVLVAVPVAVLTTFTAPFLVGLLGGARYVQDGTRALQLMIWFIPIGWINSLTQYVLIALNRQRPLRWPFVAGVSFNIAANLLFIPLFSYQASAVVTILSELVLQIGFYMLLRRAIGPIPWVEMLGRIIIAGSLMFAALFVLWSFAPIVAVIVGPLVYVGVLLVLRPFTTEEQGRLAPLLPGPLRRAMFQIA